MKYSVFYVNLQAAIAGRPHGVRETFLAADDSAALETIFTLNTFPEGCVPHLILETKQVVPDRVVWKGVFGEDA